MVADKFVIELKAPLRYLNHLFLFLYEETSVYSTGDRDLWLVLKTALYILLVQTLLFLFNRELWLF